MKATSCLPFQNSAVSLLTRPWKKYRDGTIFYGLTKSGNNRTPLTTKQGNKNMYKGTRSSGIGKHTRRGGYVINWRRVRTFVTPDHVNLDLKPLVSPNVPELRHHFRGFTRGMLDPQLYMDKLRHYILHGRTPSKANDVECHVERG